MTCKSIAVAALLVGLGACADRLTPAQDGAQVVDAAASDIQPDRAPGEQPCACILQIDTINGRAAAAVKKITSSKDPLVVVVSGTCLPDGVEVTLKGSGEEPAPVVKALGGEVTFKVKISPGPGPVTLTPAASGCAGKGLTLAMEQPPQCFFIKPKDGTTVMMGPVDVTIGTINAAGGTVKLRVDQTAYGSPLKPDATGQVAYKQVKIYKGSTVLSAVVQANSMQGTCSAQISNCGCPLFCTIKGFTPAAVVGQWPIYHALGAAQSTTPGNSTSVTTSVTVATDGTDVVLVDTSSGQTWSKVVSSGSANLQVSLLNGKRVLNAKCADAKDGRTSISPNFTILVDAAPPPAVSDLSCVSGPSAGQITCSWTGVKDNHALGAYDLRYVINGSMSPKAFVAAVKTAPVKPGAAGANMSATVGGLNASDLHIFAVKSVDLALNESALSNLPAAVKPK